MREEAGVSLVSISTFVQSLPLPALRYYLFYSVFTFTFVLVLT
jgi:hypothetical protein